jgi:hypothetical protein
MEQARSRSCRSFCLRNRELDIILRSWPMMLTRLHTLGLA